MNQDKRPFAEMTADELLAVCAARGIAGLACPSANRFGRISSTTAVHVAAEFGDELPVLDGGASGPGEEGAAVFGVRAGPGIGAGGIFRTAETDSACRFPGRTGTAFGTDRHFVPQLFDPDAAIPLGKLFRKKKYIPERETAVFSA